MRSANKNNAPETWKEELPVKEIQDLFFGCPAVYSSFLMLWDVDVCSLFLYPLSLYSNGPTKGIEICSLEAITRDREEKRELTFVYR